MDAVPGKIFGMKPDLNNFKFLIFSFKSADSKLKIRNSKLLPTFLILLFAVAGSDRAQQMPVGHATDFTSNQYFEPPHGQQVKMRLSGAEALPLPGGLLDVRQLRVETFGLDGKTQVVVRAPQCTYAPLDGVANSAGHMELQSGDGKIHVEGEGFLWRQASSSLTISNRVHTLIDMPGVTMTGT
jgi:hypothetical protein